MQPMNDCPSLPLGMKPALRKCRPEAPPQTFHPLNGEAEMTSAGVCLFSSFLGLAARYLLHAKHRIADETPMRTNELHVTSKHTHE